MTNTDDNPTENRPTLTLYTSSDPSEPVPPTKRWFHARHRRWPSADADTGKGAVSSGTSSAVPFWRPSAWWKPRSAGKSDALSHTADEGDSLHSSSELGSFVSTANTHTDINVDISSKEDVQTVEQPASSKIPTQQDETDGKVFRLYGIEATSLFSLFESRLMEIRKLDEEQGSISSSSRGSVYGSRRPPSYLQRSHSTIIHGSRKWSTRISRVRPPTPPHSQPQPAWMGLRRWASISGGQAMKARKNHPTAVDSVKQQSTIQRHESKSSLKKSICASDLVAQDDTMHSDSSNRVSSASAKEILKRHDSTLSRKSVQDRPNSVVESTAGTDHDLSDQNEKHKHLDSESPRQLLQKSASLKRRNRLVLRRGQLSMAPASPVADEEPLIEEINNDCCRVVVAGQPEVLLSLLIHPSVDEHYPEFMGNFMLTYRYHMTETGLWLDLKRKFDEWSAKLPSPHHPQHHHSQYSDSEESTPEELEQSNEEPSPRPTMTDAPLSSEERLGRLWILPNDQPLEVINRILNVLHIWIRDYSYLDYRDPEAADNETFQPTISKECLESRRILHELAEFVETQVAHHQSKQVRLWLGPLRQALLPKFHFNHLPYPTEKLASPEETNEAPPSTEQFPKIRTKANLLSLDPCEIARQLTLVEMDLFKRIRPLDLMYKSINQLRNAPNLSRLIERFNRVSYWVATEICMSRDVRVRAQVLKLFIRVAKYCFKWKNFNTTLQVVAALSMTCVQRLKQTWGLLAKKYRTEWRKLSVTFSAASNYLVYRREVLGRLTAEQEAPEAGEPGTEPEITGAIPFIGMHLSDLVFIEEGNEGNVFSNGMINFSKMRMIAATFKQLVNLQQRVHYPFQLDPFTRRFLAYDAIILDEDKLWRASRICEPPENFASGLSLSSSESEFEEAEEGDPLPSPSHPAETDPEQNPDHGEEAQKEPEQTTMIGEESVPPSHESILQHNLEETPTPVDHSDTPHITVTRSSLSVNPEYSNTQPNIDPTVQSTSMHSEEGGIGLGEGTTGIAAGEGISCSMVSSILSCVTAPEDPPPHTLSHHTSRTIHEEDACLMHPRTTTSVTTHDQDMDDDLFVHDEDEEGSSRCPTPPSLLACRVPSDIITAVEDEEEFMNVNEPDNPDDLVQVETVNSLKEIRTSPTPPSLLACRVPSDIITAVVDELENIDERLENLKEAAVNPVQTVHADESPLPAVPSQDEMASKNEEEPTVSSTPTTPQTPNSPPLTPLTPTTLHQSCQTNAPELWLFQSGALLSITPAHIRRQRCRRSHSVPQHLPTSEDI